MAHAWLRLATIVGYAHVILAVILWFVLMDSRRRCVQPERPTTAPDILPPPPPPRPNRWSGVDADGNIGSWYMSPQAVFCAPSESDLRITFDLEAMTVAIEGVMPDTPIDCITVRNDRGVIEFSDGRVAHFLGSRMAFSEAERPMETA